MQRKRTPDEPVLHKIGDSPDLRDPRFRVAYGPGKHSLGLDVTRLGDKSVQAGTLFALELHRIGGCEAFKSAHAD
jgi:hypothetical protein